MLADHYKIASDPILRFRFDCQDFYFDQKDYFLVKIKDSKDNQKFSEDIYQQIVAGIKPL